MFVKYEIWIFNKLYEGVVFIFLYINYVTNNKAKITIVIRLNTSSKRE